MLSELVQVSFYSEMNNSCCVKLITAFPINSQSLWNMSQSFGVRHQSFESLESLKMLEMMDKRFSLIHKGLFLQGYKNTCGLAEFMLNSLGSCVCACINCF